MKRINYLLIMILGGGFSAWIWAHGLDLQVEKKYPAVLVTCLYSDGSPIPYGAVKILFQEKEPEFQNGRSDRNGRFCFAPDKAGTWQFQVDDEMGHAEKIDIQVDDVFFKGAASSEKPVGKGDIYYCKILLALASILGITYGLYRWKLAREKHPHKS